MTVRIAFRVAPLLAFLACGHVVATAPPAGTPVFSVVHTVPGVPVVVAARAARALQDGGFATRRFGSDSAWATKSSEKAAARLRYVKPSSDSTKVLLELWLPCAAGDRACGRAEAATLFGRLHEEEGTPEIAP
jgi:hypothetical protein